MMLVSGVSQTPRAGFHVAVGVRAGRGGEEATDVFKDHQAGSEDGDGAGDGVPQAGAGAFGESGPAACDGDVGARETGHEDADRRDGGEVDRRDVAHVRHVRPVVFEDGGGGRGGVGVPGDGAAEGGLHAQVQAAVAAAEAADPNPGRARWKEGGLRDGKEGQGRLREGRARLRVVGDGRGTAGQPPCSWCRARGVDIGCLAPGRAWWAGGAGAQRERPGTGVAAKARAGRAEVTAPPLAAAAAGPGAVGGICRAALRTWA